MTRQTILVTGATGFLGKHIIPKLVKEGYEVLALDRHINPGLEVSNILVGDIVRTNVLDNIKPPIDYIIHLAVSGPSRCKNSSCLLDNTYSVIALVNHTKKWNTKRLILASTAAVYKVIAEGNEDEAIAESYEIKPIGLYALTKYLAEVSLLTCNVSSISMRYSFLYGEGDVKSSLFRLIQDMKLQCQPKLYDEKRDYLYVGDAADATIKALNYQGQHSVFNVGSGKLYSMPIIAEQISVILGSTSGYKLIGKRPSMRLDCSLALRELKWACTRDLCDDLQLYY